MAQFLHSVSSLTQQLSAAAATPAASAADAAARAIGVRLCAARCVKSQKWPPHAVGGARFWQFDGDLTVA
jgi:hypothetical protein